MKVLVILGLFFAYVQATSEPITVQQKAQQAVATCVQETNADINNIKAVLSHAILPVDNAEFNDFFPCYWKEVGAINRDDTFNHQQIIIMSPHMIRAQYPNAPNPEKVAEDAVKHCEPKIHGDSLAVKGINYRNCMQQYVLDTLDVQQD